VHRADLEHLLRAASAIAGERDALVIGSQSIPALIEDRLPPAATGSIEADMAFFDDPDDLKADPVDGAIGELSPFHERFGCYAQGVSVTTAILPAGWRDRLIPLDTPDTAPGRGLCLEPHDCVIAKLLAGRDKDLAFATALVRAGLIDPALLAGRLDTVDPARRTRSPSTAPAPGSGESKTPTPRNRRACKPGPRRRDIAVANEAGGNQSRATTHGSSWRPTRVTFYPKRLSLRPVGTLDRL